MTPPPNIADTPVGDALSKLSGVSKETMRELWDKVRANAATLRACSRHTFTDATPEKQIGKSFRCTACGGTIDGRELMWYLRGREHGGNPHPPVNGA